MTGRVKAMISADIYVYDLEDVQKVVDRLANEICDAEISTDENYVFFYFEEVADYYYSPAVLYTSNGDGYPAEYEDELCYYDSDDIREGIVKALKGIDVDIENISYEKEEMDNDRYDY